MTCHAARAPVRGGGWLALQRLHDDALDLGIVDLARHPPAAARRAVRRGRARRSAAATCQPFARSPARASPPPCCSSPRRSPTRSAPATPQPAPSCAASYSLPGCRQHHPTVRSRRPDDPFASPPSPRGDLRGWPPAAHPPPGRARFPPPMEIPCVIMTQIYTRPLYSFRSTPDIGAIGADVIAITVKPSSSRTFISAVLCDRSGTSFMPASPVRRAFRYRIFAPTRTTPSACTA